MHRFIYLKFGLSLVLVWVGIKMIVSHALWKIPTVLSLGIVVAIIATSVVASLLATRNQDTSEAEIERGEAPDALDSGDAGTDTVPLGRS
jgi:predicted tellurium resistance membrane protein TerC